MTVEEFSSITGVRLVLEWLPLEEERSLIERCKATRPERAVVKIYGRTSLRPRATCCSQVDGREYRYGNAVDKQVPWLPWMQRLAERIAADSAWRGSRSPDTMLINLYETRDDWIDWHMDGKKVIDHSEPTAAVSMGGERVFAMRKKSKPSHSIVLPRRSLLVMPPAVQYEWFHSIRKVSVSASTSNSVEPRWSITWRCMVPA